MLGPQEKVKGGQDGGHGLWGESLPQLVQDQALESKENSKLLTSIPSTDLVPGHQRLRRNQGPSTHREL